MLCVSPAGGLIPSKTGRRNARTVKPTLAHLAVDGKRPPGSFRVILLLRPALRPRTLERSGAAAFLNRRAGLPFSLHLSNPFGERLVTFTREKPHNLADMREKIHGFIPGGPAPP